MAATVLACAGSGQAAAKPDVLFIAIDDLNDWIGCLGGHPQALTPIIVLWSDHGWHLGEKQHWGKWTGWERSTKVPLIIVPPKKLAAGFAKPGSRCDQPVGLIDLYPTLIELCGLKLPYELDGESLVPLLRDPGKATGRKLATAFDPGNISVRSDRRRYIRYADGSEELYDLQKDPNEWDNLAGQDEHRKMLQEFRQASTRWK